MFHKIVKLNNIKQLNHISPPDHGFGLLNLIYGNNGAGKSTICKVLNILNGKDCSLLERLKSIECNANDKIDFNFLFVENEKPKSITSKNIEELKWNFKVFNQEFIDNNVYAGSKVASSNLKNYHDFCLGDASVEKQNEINLLKIENETNINLANVIKQKVESKFNSNMDLKSVIKIKSKKKFDVEAELENLNKKLIDISDVSIIKLRPKPKRISYAKPVIDLKFFDISLDSISKEAKIKVDAHIAEHLKERDVAWLESGVALITDKENCPFCAQPLSKSPIYSMFTDFLGNEYDNAVSKFESDSSSAYLKLSQKCKDLDGIKNIIESNEIAINTWRDKVQLENLNYDNNSIVECFYDLLAELDSAVQQKLKDIFQPVDFSALELKFDALFNQIDFDIYNQNIDKLNDVIDDYLLTLDKESIDDVKRSILDAENYKLKHQEDTLSDLATYASYEKKRKDNEAKIKSLREEIATEQEELISKHKTEINNLLIGFNSNIRIVEINRDNKAGGGNTRFKFKIAFLGKELSLENEEESKFLLTEAMSMGDKSALALAFFLSKFKSKVNENDIIVFDDPMSSLDSHRRNKTIVELSEILSKGTQVFVFSHDATFLTDMKKYSGNASFTKCYELSVNISDLNEYDINSSKVFKSKIIYKNDFDSYVKHSYELEYKTLHAFVKCPTEEMKVATARLIRPILEAYMRMHLPNHFTEGHWLGEMISLIRGETDINSPLYDSSNCLDKIAQINDFSKNYHHADGFDTKIRELNVQELHVVAKDTLLFITGI
ncbi:AAA family ATPase [Escherichia coli]|uniref:AAA family ATPase n=1 Tax=Enterobacteriaceae TaxID=543 RepID=UPI000DE7653C|nr:MULTISPECIES: AAA family ATPase [Enterobacteriaceae]EHH7213812.1 AAA family ATPase [Escherichia coli]ELB7482079.1 AAA family ATPase [Escherichia coli]EMC0656130.1 AAA family ATPase [Escherichia coli]MBL4455573.1 AAA family ATPase [Klebsiella pneumoniae]MCM7572319.1 AAA family ATPase [Enterobacter roggenkampii]